MPYSFDRFVFDRERGLLEGGEPVPLEPQVLDLLCYLLENRDRVVTRDELTEEIWDGRIVSDAALSTQIRSIRRALGDDRSQQKYVRTLPKRGFQFVAPVDLVDGIEAPSTVADLKQPRRRSSSRSAALFALLAFVVVAAFGSWWIYRDEAVGPDPLPKLSIAVLPFDNLSGEPEQEYFADAFTEDLITDLSRIRDAFVIARRTSFTYKGRDADTKTVAEELGVRYVLEGSVQRSGDQVRINAQLIDGPTNSHIWSDRYDRELTDAFSVQNDVTGRIAAVLKAELREADLRRQGPPASLEAWDYALRGNVLLFNPKSLEDFRNAKALLDKSLELDPSIASAWSGLAFIHFVASLRPIPGISAPDSKDLSAGDGARVGRPRSQERRGSLDDRCGLCKERRDGARYGVLRNRDGAQSQQ